MTFPAGGAVCEKVSARVTEPVEVVSCSRDRSLVTSRTTVVPVRGPFPLSQARICSRASRGVEESVRPSRMMATDCPETGSLAKM